MGRGKGLRNSGMVGKSPAVGMGKSLKYSDMVGKFRRSEGETTGNIPVRYLV